MREPQDISLPARSRQHKGEPPAALFDRSSIRSTTTHVGEIDGAITIRRRAKMTAAATAAAIAIVTAAAADDDFPFLSPQS